MVSQSVNTEYFVCIYTYLQTPTDWRAGNFHITGPYCVMDWPLSIDLKLTPGRTRSTPQSLNMSS